jgi:hypothetical protein
MACHKKKADAKANPKRKEVRMEIAVRRPEMGRRLMVGCAIMVGCVCGFRLSCCYGNAVGEEVN